MPEAPEPHHRAGEAVWVFSDRSADGQYALAVQYGEDGVFSPADPGAYAAHVVGAATRAAYDAAVMAQTRMIMGNTPGSPITGSEEGATLAAIITALRDARPEPDDAATAPLKFTPIISTRDQRPYILVSGPDGEPFTQWTPHDAMGHAAGVLAAAAVAALDNDYRDLIGTTLGAGEAAPEMISDLGRFMAELGLPPA